MASEGFSTYSTALQNGDRGDLSAMQDFAGVVLISKARHLRLLALVCLCAVTLTACSQPTEPQQTQGKKMTNTKKEVVNFDVSMLSYYERPIFDVKLNGIDIGAAGAPPHGDHAGLITGVAVPLGPQVITWRDAGTGETTKAANQPVLSHPDPKTHYLGVHIYPDNTVDVIPELFWPTNSEKGDAFLRAWEMKHGK